MSRTTFVLCNGARTGVNEDLLHRIVDALRRSDVRSYIVYQPFGEDASRRAPFSNSYDAPIRRIHDIEPGDAVVVPDEFSYLLPMFSEQRASILWFNTDNYFHVVRLWHEFSQGMLARRGREENSAVLSRRVVQHVVRNEHDERVLEKFGVTNSAFLGTYLSPQFSARAARIFAA